MKPYALQLKYINFYTGEESLKTISYHKSEEAAKVARRKAGESNLWNNICLPADAYEINKVT